MPPFTGLKAVSGSDPAAAKLSRTGELEGLKERQMHCPTVEVTRVFIKDMHVPKMR